MQQKVHEIEEEAEQRIKELKDAMQNEIDNFRDKMQVLIFIIKMIRVLAQAKGSQMRTDTWMRPENIQNMYKIYVMVAAYSNVYLFYLFCMTQTFILSF